MQENDVTSIAPNKLQNKTLSINWKTVDGKQDIAKYNVMEIYESWFATPFGEIIAMGTSEGLMGLGFSKEIGRTATRQNLIERWPSAHFKTTPKPLEGWIEAAFIGKGNIKLNVVGTKFQIAVWKALLEIAPGYRSTYTEIAKSINRPKAVRAIGTAIGRNPIGFIIPCHRVLQKSGGLGGYRWGNTVKSAILDYEGVNPSINTR